MKASPGRVRLAVVALLAAAAFAIVAVATVTVTHAQLATSPWPMFHHDVGHSGLSQFDTSADPGFQKWLFQPEIDGQIDSSPAIGLDGTIYFGSDDGNLYAVNPDGTEKWAFPIIGNGNVDSSPAIGSDGTIYVGSGNENVYAVTDGGQGVVTEKWAFAIGSAIGTSSPAIGSDGTIYVGDMASHLYAINPDGSQNGRS